MAENTKFDLDALDDTLIQEEIDINPELNPLEGPPPVDDGIHRVKLLPIESSEVEVKTTNSANPTDYIAFRFSGVVLAEGTPNNNKRVFNQVNTLVFNGKSEMAYYIQMALGDTAEARTYVKGLTNYVKLAKAFRDTLAAEPIIKVKTKWVAQRKEADEKGGKDKYSTVLSGQKAFPPKQGGGYNHVVFDRKTQTEVTANATIVDIFPDA